MVPTPVPCMAVLSLDLQDLLPDVVVSLQEDAQYRRTGVVERVRRDPCVRVPEVGSGTHPGPGSLRSHPHHPSGRGTYLPG